jgi:vacuolar-type H+-ATPase subunit I/STV1
MALQELLALHTSRSEAYDTFSRQTTDLAHKQLFEKAALNSHASIKDLLTELSSYGDAAQSQVDHQQHFLHLWSMLVQALTDKQEGEIKQSSLLISLVAAEEALLKKYTELLTQVSDMPESVTSLLTRQKEQLEKQHSEVNTLLS